MNRRGQRGQREGIATRGLGLVGLWNMLGDLFGGDLDFGTPAERVFFLSVDHGQLGDQRTNADLLNWHKPATWLVLLDYFGAKRSLESSRIRAYWKRLEF